MTSYASIGPNGDHWGLSFEAQRRIRAGVTPNLL